MIGVAKLDYWCMMLLVACVMCIDCIAETEWIHKYTTSYYNLIRFPNSMLLDDNLISDEIEAATVTSCSRFCRTRSSASLYYDYSENKCYCNSDVDTRLVIDDQTEDASDELMYGYLDSAQSVSTNTSTLKYDIQPHRSGCFSLFHHGYTTNAIYTVNPFDGTIRDDFCDMNSVMDNGADDCLQWLQFGYLDNGVYNIRLSNGTSVKAWCDQTGGGWTVIQRRQDGSVDFYRSWADYVNGFGDPEGEYWLGLEAIYLLTISPSSLRIDMETFGDIKPASAYALYDTFSLTSAADKYKLSIGAFTGDCGDSLDKNNGQKFSTWDSDNDLYGGSCAVQKHGAWWFNSCGKGRLNGRYFSQAACRDCPTGIYWLTCWPSHSLKTVSMRIKRV